MNETVIFSSKQLFLMLCNICLIALFVYLFILLVLKLKKGNNKSIEACVDNEKTMSSRIKETRIRCGLTQEYVAESLDVSRQAVSK